jgi:hypothetical protein
MSTIKYCRMDLVVKENSVNYRSNTTMILMKVKSSVGENVYL